MATCIATTLYYEKVQTVSGLLADNRIQMTLDLN